MSSRGKQLLVRAKPSLHNSRAKVTNVRQGNVAPDYCAPLQVREIERKFFITEAPPSIFDCPSALLTQGYVCHEIGRGHARVRKVEDERFTAPECYLTMKRRDGKERNEVNLPLSREGFEALWPLTEGRRLRKRRYYLSYRTLTIEVDVFEGNNAGLVLAEVEFSTAARAAAFLPPRWFGREVTSDPRFRNISLATE